jgi:hypothetical protein
LTKRHCAASTAREFDKVPAMDAEEGEWSDHPASCQA